MDSIKQNNENSYTLALDGNDDLFCVDEQGKKHKIELVDHPSQIRISSFFTLATSIIDFCLSYNGGSNNEESLLRRGIGIIRTSIKLLNNQEIQILRTLYSSRLTSIDETSMLNELKIILDNAFKTLEKVKIKKAENINLLNSKLVNQAPVYTKDIYEDHINEITLNVGNEEKKAYIVVSIFEGLKNLSAPLDKFDISIMNAVFTLWLNQNFTFSPRDVWQILNGGARVDSITSELLLKITDSLDRMRRIFVKIDATDQLKKQHYNITSAVRESYLLPLDKVERTFKGKQNRETAYEFSNQEPAFFQYTMELKQVISCPIQLLKVGRHATPELICLRISILKRVFSLRSGSMKSELLTIENLLQESGIKIQYQTQKQRYVQAIKQSLELLKKQNIIDNFTPTTKKGKSGRPSLHGFTITIIRALKIKSNTRGKV